VIKNKIQNFNGQFCDVEHCKVKYSEAVKNVSGGGLSVIRYNPAKMPGHLAAFSVGSNVGKSEVANIGIKNILVLVV